MAIRLKTPEQIERMRRAGRIVRLVLDRMDEMIEPGVTTGELDAEAERVCHGENGKCLFKGVRGRGKAGPFPGNICASVNKEVVHGIPSERVVAAGDIVSVDFGVELDGWCGDAAETFVAGPVSSADQRLVDVTRNALAISVGMCRPGVKWSAIAQAIQDYVESEKLSVVRDFVGHGIGSEMHEEPQLPNYVSRSWLSRDVVLAEGMVLAIEPMVNLGRSEVDVAADGWTVVTPDGRPSAHFEHTVAVTADGVSVLTNGS